MQTIKLSPVLASFALGVVLFGVACGGERAVTESGGGAGVPASQDAAAAEPSATEGVASPALGAAFHLPTSVQALCPVAPATFASWFSSGQVTAGGFVSAADSLATLDECDFYSWSWRMFLWLTSQGPGGLVFDSAPFFDLSAGGQLSSAELEAIAVRGGKTETVDGTGQAGFISGVLMPQPGGTTVDGSLVYYAIHVNDLYAYMASGVNSGDLQGQPGMDAFPTTAAQRDVIVDYARSAYGATIGDADALTLELKTSWVQLDPGADTSVYVTISADIPAYTRLSDDEWTWDGVTQITDATLGLVGMHVVGSVAGHPEMVWATFEHVGNAPDANYSYLDAQGELATQVSWDDGAPLPGGEWLFMDGSAREASMNQMHIELKGDTITSVSDFPVSPSNTYRSHPWGSPPVPASASNNTAILSNNLSVGQQLAAGDVRANYLLIGATWTLNGVPGIGHQLPVLGGSPVLANTSMETYEQANNCFVCHQGGQLSGLSHIFGGVQPLPRPGK